MSDPANRLSSYRSYSYYHILTICDSSETANLISQSTDIDTWQHPSDGTLPLGKYSPKLASNGVGKYCVLINGSTDSAFVITNARWSSATAAAATQLDRNTSIAIEGSLQISEPKGVVFLDQIVKCCAELGVDAATAVFSLKTFFTGFGYESTVGDFVDTINDIPPLQFIAYDVVGSFTQDGGNYEMQFVSCVNGASRLPQYSKASTGFSFTAGQTLQDTLNRLQQTIQQNYDSYYQCVIAQVKQAARAEGQDPTKIVQNLRYVNYVIEVGSDYLQNPSLYTVTDQPDQLKDLAGCNHPAKLIFPPGTSIEDAIHGIMARCPRVKQDMSRGDVSTGRKYEYKIHTAVQSTRAGGNNSELVYTVYYRIERFLRPKDISTFESFAQGSPENDPSLARNIIKFDYIYTGINTDVLDFDMKVNMGLAYLQTATLSNTYKEQLQTTPTKYTAPSAPGQTQLVRAGKLAQIPVFFGSQVRTPSTRNTHNAADSIQAAYTMTQHASIEMSDASMRIMGNTNLLGTVNSTSSPHNLVQKITTPSNDQQQSKEADFGDWGFIPAFVKVKIKMPRNNDDISLLTGASDPNSQTSSSSSRDYAQDFWFDGYYYVYGIEHNFEDGVFTQQLQMVGIPQYGLFQQQTSNDGKELDFTESVGACFDEVADCGSKKLTTVATNNTTAIPEPIAGSTTINPTNINDAKTVNNTIASPTDVNGWQSQASPTVREAILKAASIKGVNASTLAQIAAIESNFGRNTINPLSNARGVFQVIPSTWKGLVRAGKIPDVDPAQSIESLPLRDDPQYSAYAGAALMKDNQTGLINSFGEASPGDLYLAHFLGLGGARRIIRADINQGHTTSLQDALGSLYISYANANPTIFSKYKTVGELRNWAETKMAGSAKYRPTVIAQVPPTNSPSTSRDAKTVVSVTKDCSLVQDKDKNKLVKCNQTNSDNSSPIGAQDREAVVQYENSFMDISQTDIIQKQTGF